MRRIARARFGEPWLALFIVLGVLMLALGGSVWWALRRIRAPAAR